MARVPIPQIIKVACPGLTWNLPRDRKVIYLTFDDGPTPGVTGEVLSILEQYQVRATFFCIGRNAERHPEIYKQIISHGHVAGNHTYSHLKGWFTRNREYYNDINLAAQFIPSGLFRPAYGMITPAQIRHLRNQFRIVMWDVMSYDFHPGTGKEKCVENVIRCAKSGSVIVYHDSIKASEKVLYALPRVLAYFGEQEYRFKAIL